MVRKLVLIFSTDTAFPRVCSVHGWLSPWVWDPWLQRPAAHISRAGSCALFPPQCRLRRQAQRLSWAALTVNLMLTPGYSCPKNERGNLGAKHTLPSFSSLDLNSEWRLFFNIDTFHESIWGLPPFCLFLLLTVTYKEWNTTLNLWVLLSREELVTLWLGNLVTVRPTICPRDGGDCLLIWVLCLVPHIPSKTTWMSFFLASRKFLTVLKKVFVLFLQ